MTEAKAKAAAIKKQLKKNNKIRIQKEGEFAKTEKLVSLLEGEMSISYDKAVKAHREAKQNADLLWGDKKAEKYSQKRWDYFAQARAYKRQARKYFDYASQKHDKDSMKSGMHSYLGYFYSMKDAFQSYREAIKQGHLEIKYRRKELESVREVRI